MLVSRYARKGFFASNQFVMAKISAANGEKKNTSSPQTTLRLKATMTNHINTAKFKSAVTKNISR
jgi:hypothetical protein